ncbi:MAG: signal recognition particle receptor subunit alpha, partial [Thermoanaerobaculia bacterium]|nr:signal recognition particle receptor subunit alpha [Thermoanaerobaculia bacterium]
MEPKSGLWGRLRAGLARTHDRLAESVGALLDRPASLDEATLEELEEAMIAADLGVATTRVLLDRLRERARRSDLEREGRLRQILTEEVERLLAEIPAPTWPEGPRVVLVVGVNGAGKTT